MKSSSISIFRWSLRVLSGIFIVFFLFMFIGETFFQNDELDPKPLSANAILQLSVMGLGLIGLLFAWKRELIGGIIALIAYIALAIINPDIIKFPLLYLYPATAILFIVLWAISRNRLVKNE